MKIEKLAQGLTVYDVGRQKMGNTNMTTVCVWRVFIHSVDLEKKTVKASWNNNQVKEYPEYIWSKWRLKEPKLIKTGFGHHPRSARFAARRARTIR